MLPYIARLLMVRTMDHNQVGSSPLWRVLGLFDQQLLTLTAPFGATIFGWIAIVQIRRSGGALYGLVLAVADGLLFPLLALDLLIGGTAAFFLRSSENFSPGSPLPIRLAGLAIGLIAWMDFLIARRVWRAVNKQGADSGATVPHAQREVATPVTAYAAMFFSALSGALGIVAWFLMPDPPRLLSFSIFAFALFGITLAIFAWRNWLGKFALAVGSANLAIALVAASVSTFQQSKLNPAAQVKPILPDNTHPSPPVSTTALADPPKLRFLAWQDENPKWNHWKAWRPDGQPASTEGSGSFCSNCIQTSWSFLT